MNELEQKSLQGAMDLVTGQISKRQIDIESAILRVAPFDYLTASELFAALQRRLELRYDNLNPEVEEAMQKLSRAFDRITG